MDVSIRLARKGDARGFIDSWNECFNAGHLKYTGTQRRSRKDIKSFDRRYAERRKGEIVFVAVEHGGKIVGSCGFHAREHGRTRHRGEVGWMVHHDYVGRGVATRLLRAVLKEARRRGFRRVEAEAAVENIASIQLAKRLRFKIEGRKRAGILLDSGKYVDTYILGRLLR
jgi:RimJ/RimL family protein N-acetyltransferase